MHKLILSILLVIFTVGSLPRLITTLEAKHHHHKHKHKKKKVDLSKEELEEEEFHALFVLYQQFNALQHAFYGLSQRVKELEKNLAELNKYEKAESG